MIEAQAIQKDAIAIADSRNGDVVFRAIHRLDHCPDCLYPENKEIYELLLCEYTKIKISEHYWRKSIFDSPRHFWHKESSLLQCKISANEIKNEMLEIGPCEICKGLYNPTHRIRGYDRYRHRH